MKTNPQAIYNETLKLFEKLDANIKILEKHYFEKLGANIKYLEKHDSDPVVNKTFTPVRLSNGRFATKKRNATTYVFN